nr:replication factor A protein 1-like [Ipomoea batatas]
MKKISTSTTIGAKRKHNQQNKDPALYKNKLGQLLLRPFPSHFTDSVPKSSKVNVDLLENSDTLSSQHNTTLSSNNVTQNPNHLSLFGVFQSSLLTPLSVVTNGSSSVQTTIQQSSNKQWMDRLPLSNISNRNGYNVMSEGNKSPPTKRQFRSFDLNCTPEMTADINDNSCLTIDNLERLPSTTQIQISGQGRNLIADFDGAVEPRIVTENSNNDFGEPENKSAIKERVVRAYLVMERKGSTEIKSKEIVFHDEQGLQQETYCVTDGMNKCDKCLKGWCDGILRYRLRIRVVDMNGYASLLLWNREANELLGIGAQCLKDKHTETLVSQHCPVLLNAQVKGLTSESHLSDGDDDSVEGFLSDEADSSVATLGKTIPHEGIEGPVKKSLVDEFSSTKELKKIRESVVEVEI